MSQTQQESHNHLEGTVTAILFRNEENGYTVLRLDSPDRGEVTAVGCMPGVAPGETLELEGSCWRAAGAATPATGSSSRPRPSIGVCRWGRRPSMSIWPPGR